MCQVLPQNACCAAGISNIPSMHLGTGLDAVFVGDPAHCNPPTSLMLLILVSVTVVLYISLLGLLCEPRMSIHDMWCCDRTWMHVRLRRIGIWS